MYEFLQLNPMLLKQCKNGKLIHAYIFKGKEALYQALTLAAQLDCIGSGKEKPCGKCTVCQNILNGTYTDCRVIETDRGIHRIEGMREVAAKASLAPMNGNWKIFILLDADKMSEEAANMLLKLLEEPPLKTIFILISEEPDQLLSTILSRCQVFFLQDSFKNIEEIDPLIIEEAKSLLKNLPSMPIYKVLLKVKDYEKRENQRNLLLGLLTILHHAACGKIKLSMEFYSILKMETMLESALELIDQNVNLKLLLDVVFLRLWQNCQR